MKSHDDTPVPRPVPFERNKPWRFLDDWLSPELARLYPEPNTRLRRLAYAQGMRAAALSSAIAGGHVLILTGGFVWVISGNPVLMLILGPVGLALILLGIPSFKRVRFTLPNTGSLLTQLPRGPETARGGISMMLLLAVPLTGLCFLSGPEFVSQGRPVTLIGVYLLIMSVLVAVFLIPPMVIGRSRAAFRRRLQSNAVFRAAVEADRATWSDPYGNDDFGPL